MQEVTVRLSKDALNLILQALNDSVIYRQQNTAMLVAGLQGQANSQAQPVAGTPAASEIKAA